MYKKIITTAIVLNALVGFGYTINTINNTYDMQNVFASTTEHVKDTESIENFEQYITQEIEHVKTLDSFKAYIDKEARYVVTTKLEAEIYDMQKDLTR